MKKREGRREGKGTKMWAKEGGREGEGERKEGYIRDELFVLLPADP